MLARTHDLAAITALGIVVILLPQLPTVTLSTVLASLLANQLGGIAPDIDQPTAPFWRNLPIGNIFGRMFGRMLGGHRFLTHSILGLALFGFLMNVLLSFVSPILPNIDMHFVWWAFMIGMVSHLIMDMFTKEGVPWLLPIPIKFGIPPVRKLRITTGKKLEAFVVIPILLIIDIAICAVYYDELVSLVQRHVVS